MLLKYPDDILQLCPTLYEDIYLPLYHYVHEYLVTLLRNQIQISRYPHPKGCYELWKQQQQQQNQQQLSSSSFFVTLCHTIMNLESTHTKVLHSIEGVVDSNNNNSPSSVNTVLLELFHPILDRIHFHFGTNQSNNQNNNNREEESTKITSTRIDRLPEWLFKYIGEHVLGVTDDENDNTTTNNNIRPYQIILMIDPSLSIPFTEELLRLIRWIIVDQRNFFNDPIISGAQSNPEFLYNAIEQFLQFDVTIKNNIGGGHHQSSSSIMGLMDVLVVPNIELMDWWIERERESVFATLFPANDHDNTSNEEGNKRNDDVPKPLANHVSPRAEIFCALIRSVQYKAAVLSSPGKYLRGVAVPLCSQFVDALHETSVELRDLLVLKQQHSIIMEHQIVANINEWIEIINGTTLAARVLLTKERTWHYEKSGTSSQSDHDLARFGRSLERLVEVMVEEFAAAFVETILMERAKFASYLMMASHLLSSQEWEAEETGSVSVELKDTTVILQYLHRVCNSILQGQDDHETRSVDSENYAQENIAYFAPSQILTHVMNRVADKLLEVALDVNHVTPDIWPGGATVFEMDVRALVGSCDDLPAVHRLLEVTKLMTMNFQKLEGLFAALGGLVDSDAFLDVEDFTVDANLREQAVSMLKAKNVNCALEDAISILNRRRS